MAYFDRKSLTHAPSCYLNLIIIYAILSNLSVRAGVHNNPRNAIIPYASESISQEMRFPT